MLTKAGPDGETAFPARARPPERPGRGGRDGSRGQPERTLAEAEGAQAVVGKPSRSLREALAGPVPRVRRLGSPPRRYLAGLSGLAARESLEPMTKALGNSSSGSSASSTKPLASGCDRLSPVLTTKS